jgi:hypothetical protein
MTGTLNVYFRNITFIGTIIYLMNAMKRLVPVLALLLIWFCAGITACKKKPPVNPGGGATIQVETSPPAGSVQAAAPGPTFPLIVTIKSAMPPAGVKIDVTARPEGSTVAFFSESVNSSSAVNNFTITNTPVAITSVVEVTVTDLGDAANKVSLNFRYSRK